MPFSEGRRRRWVFPTLAESNGFEVVCNNLIVLLFLFVDNVYVCREYTYGLFSV